MKILTDVKITRMAGGGFILEKSYFEAHADYLVGEDRNVLVISNSIEMLKETEIVEEDPLGTFKGIGT